MAKDAVFRTVEGCVDQLVEDFRQAPNGFYKEGTVHCHLYHLFTLAGLNDVTLTRGGYRMRRVQKEYPPIRPDRDGRRGHYDLVVLDDEAMAKIDWWNHRQKREEALGVPVGPTVAVEVGVNKGLTLDADGTEARLREAEKEMRRLTNPENEVGMGLLLYLYMYTLSQRQVMAAVVDVLREKVTRFRHANLTLAAIGTEPSEGFTEKEFYELRVRDSRLERDEGAFAGPGASRHST